jgi:hypothetical protein
VVESHSKRPADKPEWHYDPGLVLAKALLNAIPCVGGSLASLIEFVPTASQRNTEKAIGFFNERLTNLENRVDVDAVDKEEFSELFQSFSRTIQRSHREEKLRAAANILANLLLKPDDPSKVSYDELDHLIRCIDALSIGAITVLGGIRHISAAHPLGPYIDTINFGQLRTQLQINSALVRSLVAELQAFHLVRIQETGIRGSGEEEHDGALITISPIGTKLIERFIEGNM